MPTWDEAKRGRNVRVRGLDFVGAEAIYVERSDDTHIIPLRRADRHEARYCFETTKSHFR
jgi:uncharacterized DUF497 family protein